MVGLKHHKGDLFSAPSGVYLAHACNCQGKWNSGIAYQFRQRFPKSFEEYHAYCLTDVAPSDLLICSEERGYRVICLFTSKSFGAEVDSPADILAATKAAIGKLPSDRPIHMPRINAGLFKVPWEETERLLSGSGHDMTVWTPEVP